MFDVSLLDHLRLSFGHAVHSHRAHAQMAQRLSRRSLGVKLVEVGLIALVAASALAVVFGAPWPYMVAAAVLGCLGLAVAIVHLALNFEPLISAHRHAGVRLWLIREKYRALLSDLGGEIIEMDVARARRDSLMEELHAIYQNVPPINREAFIRARQALLTTEEDRALTDEDIDRLLPKSLRKAVRTVDVST